MRTRECTPELVEFATEARRGLVKKEEVLQRHSSERTRRQGSEKAPREALSEANAAEGVPEKHSKSNRVSRPAGAWDVESRQTAGSMV